MLEGDGNGVTVEYTAKELTRLGAAAALLKLKGLYDEAIAFQGEDNFADVKDYAWVEGRNLMAYLKANPGLGFGGDEKGNFNPGAMINEQSYYKVLLETLGYKQTTAEVAGDFAWEEVFTFAESVGLKPAKAEKFTIDELAKATFAALKATTKDGKVYIDTLIAAGVVTEELAVAAGVKEEVAEVAVAVDSVAALGNTVVEVVFEEDVDAAVLENAEYVIEGLEIKSVTVTGSDAVRLETAAMTAGKVYTLTVGEEKVKFTGVGKVSGAPSIDSVVSEDIEEVVITFNKNIDFETGSDVANYTISGVEIVAAEVDEDEVTLTTEGLVSRKQYTVKVTGVKSVDGGLLKSASKSFYTRPDTSAPKVEKVEAETNERVIILFNEEVTKESAENIANYTIKAKDTELAILEAKLVEDPEDEEEKQVELTTEVQKANTKYEISISNIVDTTKAENTMAKAVKKTFYGKKEDTTAPSFVSAKVVSRNHLEVKFKDASRFDEASVLDVNNYTLTKSSEDYVIENAEKLSFKDGIYAVLLTVEELEVGSYSLKVTDIADEFGNALEEKKTTVSAKRDNLAAATVKSYEVTDTDTIKVKFTAPLNEATAEDVSNYEFNNDIGAPVKVTYDNDDYSVKIKTAEFVQGKTYKLTIDGVEDLAGNVLDLNFKFVAVKGDVDDEAPELVDIYAINKYVVAVAFDEEVEFASGAKITLDEYDNNDNFVKTFDLIARTTSEDDTVVEFSDYGNKVLDSDCVYKVVTITGIVDEAGNDFVEPADYDDFVVYGTEEEPEPIEVLNITQKNAKTFEVTMSGDVQTMTNVNVSTVAGGTSGTFKANSDDDDEYIVYFEKQGTTINENGEYRINLSSYIKDKHGIPTENIDDDNYTIFYAEYKDDEKPYIVNVVAVDRYTVEIEYSEEINTPGSYVIKNADETVSKTAISANAPQVDTDDRKLVTIELNVPLEGRYDYKLIIGSTAAKDFANNSAEEAKDDEFFFNGTDLEPVASDVDAQKAVEEEAMKYVTSVTVAEVAEDVYVDLMPALKTKRTAGAGFTVKVLGKEGVQYAYLDPTKVQNNTEVYLDNLPANVGEEVTEVVVLEFTKNGAKATIELTVTIVKVTP